MATSFPPQETSVIIMNELGNLFFTLYKAETGIQQLEKEDMQEDVKYCFLQPKPLVADKKAFAKAVSIYIDFCKSALVQFVDTDKYNPMFISHAIYALKIFKDFTAFKKKV